LSETFKVHVIVKTSTTKKYFFYPSQPSHLPTVHFSLHANRILTFSAYILRQFDCLSHDVAHAKQFYACLLGWVQNWMLAWDKKLVETSRLESCKISLAEKRKFGFLLILKTHAK
jgi:hypothetical protein